MSTYKPPYNKPQKLETIMEKNEGEFYQFNEDFSPLQTPDTLESLNQDLPRESLPSLQEIAKLPIAERHKLLSPFMEDMAEDFNRDPELTIFSVLDGEGID